MIVLSIKSRERQRREIEEKKKEVIRSIMPERHYNMLEVVAGHWNTTMRGIDMQVLGERLRGKEGMTYPHIIEDIERDVLSLCEWDYVFCDGDSIVFPTHRGMVVYSMVHSDARIVLRDLK